jgi:nucleotide-binding universal stress UspA family protein
MMDKILWTSDGSKDSIQALKYAELLTKRFKAEILGLFVIPDYSDGVFGRFPSDEKKNEFIKWIAETKSRESKALEDIARDFKEKGINFKKEIESGIPFREILRVADREKVDFIAMGKGRPFGESILGGTALKVLRQSPVPVLTAREGRKSLDIRRILVPTDTSPRISKSLKYAVELSKEFSATIYLLNIVEVGRYDFPIEIIEQMRGFSFREIEENVGKIKVGENIETCVEVAKNAWRGIVKFVDERDIDLIVMMTYGGGRLKEDFIGSIAEKVIQEATCPVITMKP